MEAAGIVLAVLPLVLEAFEVYSTAAEALYTFKRYNYVVAKLKAMAITQRALFVNSSDDLKSAIQDYKNTMERRQWSHSELGTEQRVHMSLHACSVSLDPIMASLNEIKKKLEPLEHDVNTSVGPGLRIKLRLIWSKSQIDDELERLERMVNSFWRISTEAAKLIDRINQNAQSQPHQNNTTWTFDIEEKKFMETITRIRQASVELHSNLGKQWPCLTHDSHGVYICSAKRSNDRCLAFEAVLVGYEGEVTKDFICMEVESINQSDNVTMTVNTRCSEEDEGTADPCNAMQIDSDPVSSPDIGLCHGNTSTDLTQLQDLCLHFQQQHGKMKSGKHLLGYLSLQRIFSLGPDRRVSGKPYSLADLVRFDGVGSSLSMLEKTNIAASLATSVLQFYSTPWLPGSWSSINVVFFGKNSWDPNSFSPLYFGRQLERIGKGKSVEHGDVASSTMFGGPSARNEVLFQLGLALLETGMARSWDSLRRDVIKNTKSQEGVDNYHVAYTLACTRLLRQTGPTYSRIVRKCLGCDFGLGETDFDNERLQVVFHRDVVEVLIALQSMFQEGRAPVTRDRLTQ